MIESTIRWFNNVAETYDQYRPRPPAALHEVYKLFGGHTTLAVDVGAGTGSSTRFWFELFDRVVGVEPNPEMLALARSKNSDPRITYLAGSGTELPLSDGSADLISCFQSLHWMEPQHAFAEFSRVLTKDGLLIVADYQWPPITGSWEVDAAWHSVIATARILEKRAGCSTDLMQWEKKGHFARLRASGKFKYVKQFAVHEWTRGGPDEFIGLLRSQLGVAAAVNIGHSEADIGLDRARSIAASHLTTDSPWLWTCVLCIAQKHSSE